MEKDGAVLSSQMLNYLIYHQILTFTVYHLFYYKGQNDLEILQKGESG